MRLGIIARPSLVKLGRERGAINHHHYLSRRSIDVDPHEVDPHEVDPLKASALQRHRLCNVTFSSCDRAQSKRCIGANATATPLPRPGATRHATRDTPKGVYPGVCRASCGSLPVSPCHVTATRGVNVALQHSKFSA